MNPSYSILRIKVLFIKFKAVEEENIAKAVEEQRLLDNSHAKEELDLELKRLKDQLDVDYERRVK